MEIPNPPCGDPKLTQTTVAEAQAITWGRSLVEDLCSGGRAALVEALFKEVGPSYGKSGFTDTGSYF